MPQARDNILVFVKNNIPSKELWVFHIRNDILHIPIIKEVTAYIIIPTENQILDYFLPSDWSARSLAEALQNLLILGDFNGEEKSSTGKATF